MAGKTHYHCLSGLHGYMPDDNTPCRTKAEALSIACEHAKNLRSEGIRVCGRKADGYYEVHTMDACDAGCEYIEVTTCDVAECWEDIEDGR